MKKMVYIGIGASAGGLQALQKLVFLLPQHSQNVYIIAQHLLPDKKSALGEILSRYTSHTVEEITPTTSFLSDHIYIIPPNCNLLLKNHHLVLEEDTLATHHSTPSVDLLFESLAHYAKSNAVAILLSGTGHDGTAGMRAIQKHEGRTIAQFPKEASYQGMPQSAIDAGVVDHVYTLEEMGSHLHELLKKSEPPIALTPLEAIQQILHTQENLDLSKYKGETILRRITKRRMMLHLSTIELYLQYLIDNATEAHLLYQDILIGVTSFFRDKEAFEALEVLLTNSLADKPPHYEFRIWCVACSSGEEAYTLAIVVCEICKKLGKTIDLRIFATDIDDDALAKGRSGEYLAQSLKSMESTLLETYFTPTKNGYQVNQWLRQQIVFTHHNLLQDPPFINQDLISCRNLLIYILPNAQKEVFALFHYSLKPHGMLFLGSSESTLLSINYFAPLDSQSKIYEKETLQNPPRISTHYFSKHLDKKTCKEDITLADMGKESIEERMENAVFSFFSPHCVIVDRHFTMIYRKGEIPVLRFRDGVPSLNLLDNLDELPRYEVKSLIEGSFNSNTSSFTRFIEISSSDVATHFIRVVATPFNNNNQTSPMMLLYFQELSSDELQFNSGILHLPNESVMIKNLTAQLSMARREIQSLSNELSLSKETQQVMNEELQSSNEELQSSNEELQSSNEELETSNEELQSSNEELHTSLTHIEKLQNHLSLLFDSTFDGIIGLDKEANHTFVNTAAATMLGYRVDEMIGKESHSLWHHTKRDGSAYPEEECPTTKVMKEGVHRRQEDLFWRKDGTSFEVELLQSPIFEEGKVTGAVISFHDITEKKQLEKIVHDEQILKEDLIRELEMEKLQLEHVLEFAPIPIMIHDEKGAILFTNRAFEESTGYLKEELRTMQEWMEKLYPEETDESRKKLTQCYETPMISAQKEHLITTKTGERKIWLISSVRLNSLHNNEEMIVSSAIDITEVQRKDEIMISQSRQAAMGDMLAMIAHQWRQPLSVIGMATNTLKLYLELEEEITPDALEQLIETINKQVNYLSHTIDDFRDFFKPDKVKERINVAVILERLVALIQKGLENNAISLELPENQNIEIFTYSNQLLQALINIVNNAKDAIKEHPTTIGVIRISLYQEVDELIIEICDNGGGISPSIFKNIAEPYVSTKAANGTGLGLYMSKMIITKHLGGRLGWKSDNNGSCFSIALPTDNT